MKAYDIDKVDQAKATLVFAHGAGADMSSDFIQRISLLLNQHKINVIRFNFPYMEKRAIDGKRRPPERMPKLVDDFELLLEQLDKDEQFSPTLPLFVGGKSMGSRVAATFLAEQRKLAHCVQGLVAIGYPFHPVGKPESLRLTPLMESEQSALIIQGDRDKLGNKEEVDSYQLPPHCQVSFLADGDHDIKPRVKSGFTHQQHLIQACVQINRFIDENS